MSSERKYTDRDVRDNLTEAIETVTDYLESYTGEFEYLVDCKMRLAHGMTLSVGMMRGVLNCMRNDPRVKDTLPEPLPEQPAEVVSINRASSRQRKWGPADCDIETDHGGHYIGDEELFQRRHYCSGRWSINREAYTLPAKIKPIYTSVVTRTGALIHRLTGEALVTWFPHSHKPGFIGEGSTYLGKYSSGSLIYLTSCKGASHIRNGILLTDDTAKIILKDREPLNNYIAWLTGTPPPPSQRKELSMCKRCWQ